jgi:hypothetical protein
VPHHNILFSIWRTVEDGDPVKVEEIMAPTAPEALARYLEDNDPDGEFAALSVRTIGAGTFRVIAPPRHFLALPAPQHRSAA